MGSRLRLRQKISAPWLPPPCDLFLRLGTEEKSTTACRSRPGWLVALSESRWRNPRARLKPEQNRRVAMRVMVIIKASADSEAGKLPSQALLTAMGKYNEELVKAGIMLDGEGLKA